MHGAGIGARQHKLVVPRRSVLASDRDGIWESELEDRANKVTEVDAREEGQSEQAPWPAWLLSKQRRERHSR